MKNRKKEKTLFVLTSRREGVILASQEEESMKESLNVHSNTQEHVTLSSITELKETEVAGKKPLAAENSTLNSVTTRSIKECALTRIANLGFMSKAPIQRQPEQKLRRKNRRGVQLLLQVAQSLMGWLQVCLLPSSLRPCRVYWDSSPELLWPTPPPSRLLSSSTTRSSFQCSNSRKFSSSSQLIKLQLF